MKIFIIKCWGERLDKEQQSIPKVSRKKEIKVKGEVNRTENRRQGTFRKAKTFLSKAQQHSDALQTSHYYVGLDKSDYCSEDPLETNHSKISLLSEEPENFLKIYLFI